MASMNIKIKNKKQGKRLCVEMDADILERMAANFGFFGENFLSSVKEAEGDYKNGRFKKISSLSSIK
ncbi:MAG: hypothetical protein U9Q85_01590 [Patescibacteria group bacterium]|nr:hypothetical protein [Patescibacteria group bacterium]